MVLLIDGNWLMVSRVYALGKGMNVDAPEAVKEMSAKNFKELLARSIAGMLYKFPITNIVLVADGGSWRKELPVPPQLGDVKYKGNRSKTKSELDFPYVYKTFEEFFDTCSNYMTTSKEYRIEGDDWMWYWSRKINASGDDALIWSSDRDLQQLVQIDGGRFTAWYNDKAGLVLPESAKKEGLEDFMGFEVVHTENIERCCDKVTYINPFEIVTEKILCGDAGDNIKPVVRVEKKGRMYGFSKKYYDSIIGDYGKNFFYRFDEIAEEIAGIDYFRARPEAVREMLDYNKTLVWISEETIPEPLLTQMVKYDLKPCDVNEIKVNYKLLAPENLSLDEIFDSI